MIWKLLIPESKEMIYMLQHFHGNFIVGISTDFFYLGRILQTHGEVPESINLN